MELLKRTFGDAISLVRDTDSTGKTSTAYAQRATLVFVDDSKLYITEHIRHGVITHYYYDWISKDDKQVLAKFHCEPHQDEDYQTTTEPYHIHPPEYSKLTNQTRFANHSFTSLFAIVEGIFLFHIIPNKPHIRIQKGEGNPLFLLLIQTMAFKYCDVTCSA
ncbi:toxin-antitoxin system TumE family protein [Paenibacillus terrae]|uniref:toxin-antitoxin system TumE family protein n=2 Tax=Paenibacillus TaxID=44249 RepID=UPI0011EB1454|nr:DUF6516 family protein [Paenibacillus terrae]